MYPILQKYTPIHNWQSPSLKSAESFRRRREKGLPMAISASMLWRRIDVPGHDTCRLEQEDTGWKLEGTTVFGHRTGPASISYSVRCDVHWKTLSGQVRGILGNRKIDYVAIRQARDWELNGSKQPGLGHLVDLDLSFTPATNFQQLQRVSIAQGEAVELPVAWLDVDAGTLEEMPQIYRRRSKMALWYEAPTVGYKGMLELAPNGFIRLYPGLWEAEPKLQDQQ
jgi:hypothetical protein